ncbi:MAG TPA: polysaccharide ABC transporter ATP-binding protein [Bacteroidales bacterium]|nr:polysaccharide ABC transporter ATP-binding protein [Bacteroidales bacterium]
MPKVIQVENLSKQYRLGFVGSNTLKDDINRYWARIRGKEDPRLKVGDANMLASDKQLNVSAKLRSDYIWALKDINFNVQQGEVLGIIGKNGAGKSTLLKILSKVTAPTTGSVKVKGRIASLLEVGTGFHPELSGRENIFLNGAILGMTKTEIRSKFDEIVDFSGVENYIDTPVKRYSSGMYVRLAFAVAAHLDPEILIVDEVLAVGDSEFQKKALGRMQNVSHSEGRTVLFVSHNMSAIQTLCETCILLKNGKIVSNGKTIEVVSNYLKQNTANKAFNRPLQLNGNPTITKGTIDEGLLFSTINLTIKSDIETFASIDFRLTDCLGIAIGFGSIGAMNESQLISIYKGENCFTFSLNVSKLAIGQYTISLDLTVPDKAYFDRIENCLMFEVIRKPDENDRRVLKQTWGYGSFELDIQML